MKENNIGCDIARDLMPLVIDEAASAESTAAVEAHVSGCAECRKTMEDMRAASAIQAAPAEEPDTKFIRFCKGVEREMKKDRFGRRLSALLAILLALLLLSGLTHYMMYEHAVPVNMSDPAIAQSLRLYQDQFGQVYYAFENPDALRPVNGCTGWSETEKGALIWHEAPKRSAWPQLFGVRGYVEQVQWPTVNLYVADGQLVQNAYDSWYEYDENGLEVQKNRLVSSRPVAEFWIGEGGSAVCVYRQGDALELPVVEQSLPGFNG